MTWYRIYVVRFDKLGEGRKELDRILCIESRSFTEAKRIFLNFMYDDEGFSKMDLRFVNRKLAIIREKDFKKFGAYTTNMYGRILGPGGYLMVKEKA